MEDLLKYKLLTIIGFLAVFIFYISILIYWGSSIGAFLSGGAIWFIGVSIKGVIWSFWEKWAKDRWEKRQRKARNTIQGVAAGVIGAIGELGVTCAFFLVFTHYASDRNWLLGMGIGAGLVEAFFIFLAALYSLFSKSDDNSQHNHSIILSLVSPFERFYTTGMHWAVRYLVAQSIATASLIPFSIAFISFAFADGFAHYAVLHWDLEKRQSLFILEGVLCLNALLVVSLALFFLM